LRRSSPRGEHGLGARRLAQRRFERGGPHADAFVAYAEVLREAYAQRLQTMGESQARAPSSTTHLNAIDRDATWWR